LVAFSGKLIVVDSCHESREKIVNVQHPGSQASATGPEACFTGPVRIDPLFGAVEPSRVTAGIVTFEPCARSAWHTHPLGQKLIVTFGCGRVQRWGGPIEEIRPGDVVIIEPGEKHWHGAAPTTAMTHIAIQESLEGRNVDWLEKVTDEQYRAETSESHA
jgi:quercetin dioxygenase-like cupin family protein